MSEQIELQKLKEEYPEFFRKTSPELIDFIFSDKTSEKIADIAAKNGVSDEEVVEGIAQRVTWVLLDRLPSGNLAMTFELGLKISPDISQKIADEANQFISSETAQWKLGRIIQPKEASAAEEITEEEPRKPSSKDVYREPVE